MFNRGDNLKVNKLRNTILFIVGVNIVGWITVLLATESSINFILQQVFIIGYLLSPFLTAMFLRTFGKDGWKNSGIKFNFRESKKWYIISILIFPIALTINLFIALSINGFVMEKSFVTSIPSILVTGLIAFIPKFIKNIGEEFGWRGYLEPQLKDIGIKSFKRHIITGFVWALWHLPIIFLTQYTNEGMLTYLPRFFLGTIIFSFVYGQIRDISKTVWTSVLLHSVGNAFGNTLYQSSSLAAHRFLGITPESFVAMFSWLMIAIILWKIRVNKYKESTIEENINNQGFNLSNL